MIKKFLTNLFCNGLIIELNKSKNFYIIKSEEKKGFRNFTNFVSLQTLANLFICEIEIL